MAKRTSSWGIPIALRALAGTYLVCVVLDGAGCTAPARFLPRPIAFFTQVSVLFPKAAYFTIDYRAEGFRCKDATWVELDTRPYFPIDPDDKENRFNRAMHFFRENRKTMQALDKYLVHENNTHADERIGGVRMLSLRIPIPKIGTSFERYTRYPLAHYPESERQYFYHTTDSLRARRCGPRGGDE
jgi:hypothetical protein